MTNETIDKINQSSVETLEKSILLDGLASKLNTYQQQRNELLERKYRLKYVLSTYHPFEILNPPYMPEEPVSPNIKLNIAIASVLGLMLGVFIVFVKEFMAESNNIVIKD
nr:GNVR domain-containing protein [Sporohalobacter salinus]